MFNGYVDERKASRESSATAGKVESNLKIEYKHPNPKAISMLIATFDKNLSAAAPGNMIKEQALDDFARAMQSIPVDKQTPDEKKLLNMIQSR